MTLDSHTLMAQNLLTVDEMPNLEDYSSLLNRTRGTTSKDSGTLQNYDTNSEIYPSAHNSIIHHGVENINPNSALCIPASALNSKTGQLQYSHSNHPSLFFDSINAMHCNTEAVIPPGTYAPMFRIRVKDPTSLSGLNFKISCVRSSLDLLLWATREDVNDSSLVKVLSEILISGDAIHVTGGSWFVLSLKPFYLENTTKVFIEIINVLKNVDNDTEFEIDQIIFQPQSSSPIKVNQKRESQNTSPESSFTCSFEGCHRSFCRIQNLKSHEKIHLPNRKRFFVCHICQAGFTRSQDLTRHVHIHSGEKNFKCPGEGCKKSFSRKDALRRHIRSVKCCDLENL